VFLDLPVVGQDSDDDFDLLEAEYAEPTVTIADPLQPINCVMFHLNDAAYTLVIKPVSRGYKAVTTKPMRIGLHNFFQNISTPIRFANCLLQGKGDSAGVELRRFLINSTEGCLGLGDPAHDKYGLELIDEDLGQTLAVYGFEDGIYLVLPLLGPSTLRDTAGRMGDAFLNPVSYLEPTEAYIGVKVLQMTNVHAIRGDEYDSLKADAISPYTAMRDMYFQYRKRQIEE
jgi:phospholipid-binding lipoprotein MlaA